MSTANIFDLVDVWNDAATTFTAIKMDVTDTASNAASNLLDLQVGGSSRFRVQKNGFARFDSLSNSQVIGINGTTAGIGNFFGNLSFYQGGALIALVTSNTLRLQSNTFSFSWGPAQDLELFRDAADTLAQRRGTNAQAFNLYNTFTNATNYERARMGWAGNAFEIKPQADGTGTERVLHISGLPTSNPGPGILWNDGGDVKVGT